MKFLKTTLLLVLICAACSGANKLSVNDRMKLEDGAISIVCGECLKDSSCLPDFVSKCERLLAPDGCESVGGGAPEGAARGSIAPDDGGSK